MTSIGEAYREDAQRARQILSELTPEQRLEYKRGIEIIAKYNRIDERMPFNSIGKLSLLEEMLKDQLGIGKTSKGA